MFHDSPLSPVPPKPPKKEEHAPRPVIQCPGVSPPLSAFCARKEARKAVVKKISG